MPRSCCALHPRGGCISLLPPAGLCSAQDAVSIPVPIYAAQKPSQTPSPVQFEGFLLLPGSPGLPLKLLKSDQGEGETGTLLPLSPALSPGDEVPSSTECLDARQSVGQSPALHPGQLTPALGKMQEMQEDGAEVGSGAKWGERAGEASYK